MLFDIFKKNTKKAQKKQKQKRGFNGAKYGLTTQFCAQNIKINGELKRNYKALIQRAREMYKNSPIVASYVNGLIRNTLADKGFTLSVTAYNDNGLADFTANKTIQDLWCDYTSSSAKYVSADQQDNDIDFDRKVLFNLLIDGECFIQRVIDKNSKYKIRYKIIDSLLIDTLYNVDIMPNGNKIVMGIQVNEHNKPIAYYKRVSNNDTYLTGQRIRIQAQNIIHIKFRSYFADQIRGYTPLAPILININGLTCYINSEIQASNIASIYMGIWQKVNNNANAYQQYDEQQVDQDGNVAEHLQGGVFRYAPQGYTLKNIQNSHPNGNSPSFLKAMLKQCASALGVSYNVLTTDVSETSYSALKQANIQDYLAVKQIQRFLIDNWKNVQYADWLKYLLLSDLTDLPYSQKDKYMVHDFRGRNFDSLDETKQMYAIQTRLSMGLSSPIEQIINLNKSPEDVLNQWQVWNKMLKDRELQLSDTVKYITEQPLSNQDIQKNENN